MDEAGMTSAGSFRWPPFSFVADAAGAMGGFMARFFIAWLIALFLLPATAMAAEPHMQVALVAATTTPRAGTQVAVPLALTPQQGWHGYWLATGHAGTSPPNPWALHEGPHHPPLSPTNPHTPT